MLAFMLICCLIGCSGLGAGTLFYLDCRVTHRAMDILHRDHPYVWAIVWNQIDAERPRR
jgi:hypothetical protein